MPKRTTVSKKTSKKKRTTKKTSKKKRTKKITKFKSKRNGTLGKPADIARVAAAAQARRNRSLQALKLYESGVGAMQRGDFSAAEKTLLELVSDYRDERELHERARLYIAVCQRQAIPKPTEPKSENELLLAATLALNGGAIAKALSYLNTVAKDKPDSAHAHYMLAVAHTLADNADEAIRHLEQAIALDPDNGVLARQESDFEPLHGDDRFQRLTGLEEAASSVN